MKGTSMFFDSIHIHLRIYLLCVLGCLEASAQQVPKGTLDRKTLVTRHNIKISDPQLAGPTQVGNGNFAYGFDITGMQTFNDQFTTMSNWSWHSTAAPKGTNPANFRLTEISTHGRMVPYALPDPKEPALSQWLASNPHRFNLGRIGLWLKKDDGGMAILTDLQHTSQHLDLWTGIAESYFSLEGASVKVTTVGDPEHDMVAFKIESSLISEGRLGVFIKFPYASLEVFSNGSDYQNPSLHQTTLSLKGSTSATFNRCLDSTRYHVSCTWTGAGKIEKQGDHFYKFIPGNRANVIEYVFAFSPSAINYETPSFSKSSLSSTSHWASFWKNGGAIDLSKSKDPRWFELERRIVLSQYAMAINAAGNYPPQETGLVNNSWYGRFHYEMYWWHAAHYALWDRWSLLNKSLHVYQDNLASSVQRAQQQGYSGARWPKCTGPDGREWPHEIHAYLIWQQPHPLFFANLDYRAHPGLHTLKKWEKVVEQTTDFLASYAFLDTSRQAYILGPPIQVVSENNPSLSTTNPAFELAYWRYGLNIGKTWRQSLQQPSKPAWDTVLEKLAPLPVEDSLYVQWEDINHMWTTYNYEHPALTGIFGILPGDHIDTAMMQKTLSTVLKTWDFNKVWGWDFPMVAINAARLGRAEDAVNMLLYPSDRFGFDEHGLVGGGNPYPYFPANGGLLYAVAMMTAGWDGDNGVPQPGWPTDGSWVIRWEDLKKAP